jgi:hypothetical protein
MKIVEFLLIIWRKFSDLEPEPDKLESEPELEPDKNGPAPQHWLQFVTLLIIHLPVCCISALEPQSSEQHRIAASALDLLK